MNAKNILTVILSVIAAIFAFFFGRRSGKDDGQGNIKRAGSELKTAESQFADCKRQNNDAQSELRDSAEQLEVVAGELNNSAEHATGAGADIDAAAKISKRNEDLITELRKRHKDS